MERNVVKKLEKVFIVLGVLVLIGILSILLLDKWNVSERKGEQEEAEDKGEGSLQDSTYLLPTGCAPYDKIPEIWFENQEGRVLSIEEFIGKNIVLVYFAGWCPDCTKQMASMKEYMELAETLGDIEFLFVNKGDERKETREEAKEYFEQLELEAELYFDISVQAFETLGIRNIPTTFFLDEKGNIMAWSCKEITSKSVFEGLLQNAIEGNTKALALFIEKEMMNEKGGISSSYSGNENQEVLAESQGLMMQYAVCVKNQMLFDTVYGYVKHQMLLEEGLIAWKVEQEKRSTVNALVDDLRIYSALSEAQYMWGGYEEDMRYYEELILQYGIKEDRYVDFYDSDSGKYGNRFTLCYGDLYTMKELAQKNIRFLPAYEHAEVILRNGKISEDFPLYYSWFNYDTMEYEAEDLHTAEAMLTLLHLAEANLLEEGTIAWLKTQMSGEGLGARYTTEGKVVEGYRYDSTAVYALVTLIAEEIGDQTLRGQAIKKMEKMRQIDTSISYNGAFSSNDGSGIIAFDQLLPLLTYAKIEGSHP